MRLTQLCSRKWQLYASYVGHNVQHIHIRIQCNLHTLNTKHRHDHSQLHSHARQSMTTVLECRTASTKWSQDEKTIFVSFETAQDRQGNQLASFQCHVMSLHFIVESNAWFNEVDRTTWTSTGSQLRKGIGAGTTWASIAVPYLFCIINCVDAIWTMNVLQFHGLPGGLIYGPPFTVHGLCPCTSIK